MKPPKILSRDYKPLEQPQDTFPFGKNGIRKGNTDAAQNEPGFAISSANIPYDINGIVETDTYPLIFSTDDVNSAIGFYNEDTDEYSPVVNDASKSYKLGFRRDKYIKGEARRNYKNNIEVSWLDKWNPLRFMDTTEPPEDLSNYLLFPEYVPPTLDLEIVNGGTLSLGAYFAAARYINDDGTETRYGTATNPIFALAPNFAAIPGSSTGKSVKINISGLDPNYTKVQIAVIRRVKGVTTAVELPAIPITGDTNVLYTGTEGEDIALEEVMIPGAYYNNAGSITQLNDILYLADMQEAQTYNLQKYANLVRIRWKSELREDIESDELVKTGKLRTHKHGEAYAVYLKYYFTNGTSTDLFHIPGPKPTSDDLSSDPTVAGAKKFHTNTVGMKGIVKEPRVKVGPFSFSGNGGSGETGVWVNENEIYPTGTKAKASFDSSDVGGEDLRGQKVRHHKMPTLNQTFKNFYNYTGSKFGITGLDVLGIQAENVVIPPELQGQIIGYELFYAKRDYSNATIASQGMVILGAKSESTGGDYHFTGGNFGSRLNRSDYNSTTGRRAFGLVADIFKLHHADLMVNRPAVIPSFLAMQYRLQSTMGRDALTSDTDDETGFISDYYGRGNMKSTDYIVNPVKDTGYLLNNGAKGQIKNTKSEDGFVGTFINPNMPMDWETLWKDARETEGNEVIPGYEQGHLVDVVTVKSDIYRSFNTQDVVRTGIINPIDVSLPKKFAFNGDCFLTIHSYWSYGLADSPDRYFSQPGRVDGINNDDEDTYVDEFYLGTSGNKVARRYVTESSMNLWQRYADPAIPESKFWPFVNADFMNGMDRNKDHNVISISKDASSLGDVLNGVKTYDFEQVNISESPYKVIRSSKQAKEGKRNSWKNFNALDYYEADKNMGRIMNLQAYDDRLIIHHRNALYITQDKTTLQGDILSVTLGSGDIFRFPPKKGKESKQGYAGTQHQLACMLTDYGYIFPDAETGTWFVLNGEGLKEMNNDLYNFFRAYLNIPDVNPFIGNGICVGYDSEFKRVLITVKNKELPTLDNYVPNYEEIPEFFAKLVPGESIVFREGRYMLYKGTNTSQYECTVVPPPVIGDYTFTIDELRDPGFFVGKVTGTGVSALQYLIVGGNTDGAFVIDSITGKILVSNKAALNTELRTVFNLTVKVTDLNGKFDTGLVTVNLNSIALPIEVDDYEITVNEGISPNTNLQLVTANDPKDFPITYSIVSQTVPGAVKIDPSTGQLSVNSSAGFDFETNPLMDVQVKATNGIVSATSLTRIHVLDINEAPIVADKTVTIPNTTPNGSVVMTYDQPTDPDPADVLSTTVLYESVPGAFTVNTTNRTVTLAPGTTLNPIVTPFYIITVRVSDDDPVNPKYSDMTLKVNIQNICSMIMGDFEVNQESASKASAKATTLNGAGPYTYAWSNGQTGQTATNLDKNTEYTVVVTDSVGCTATGKVTPNVSILTGLSIEVMYFDYATTVTTDPYYPRGCAKGHGCNRARFMVKANGIDQGIANMNNAGGTNAANGTIDDHNLPPGPYNNPSNGDRYWKKVLSGAEAASVADGDGKVTITLVYTATDGSVPHSDAIWVRIKKEDGTLLASACVDAFAGYTFDPYA